MIVKRVEQSKNRKLLFSARSREGGRFLFLRSKLFFFFLSRYEFFNELYHRFLLTPKVNMKCLCLQALAIVYGRCYEEIGPFSDTKYMVGMLERVRFLLILNCNSIW